jgi:hypothetical protein
MSAFEDAQTPSKMLKKFGWGEGVEQEGVGDSVAQM